ncbi:MAG: ABC transporter ATP-binding protein [Eubacterium sp.]|nr:ABC transporter ATP-binding protein [Eubacterium sp.]MCI8917901.1 ABC transporter ATP-binding protein [Eubacterium sp.]
MIRIVKKFRSIMTHEQQMRILLLGFLMVIGGILEMLGVSMVLPLMTAVMDKNFMEKSYVQTLCSIFRISTYYEVMMLLLGALIFIYIFKNAFLFLEYFLQYRFVCNNRFLVQRRLLEVYMYRPYEFYLNATTGEIMRIINTDTINAFNLLTTVLNFFTEVVVSAALITIIFILDPSMAALIGLVLGIIMVLMFKAVKPVLRRASQKFMKNTSLANKWLLQSLNGIKDVKVSHKEEYFIDEYAVYGRQAIDAEKINSVVTLLPRLLIEAVSVASVLAVIMGLLSMGQSLDKLMPQLTAFAFAAVRLLPSTTRISGAVNSAAFQEPMLDNLIKNLNAAKDFEQQKQKEQQDELRRQEEAEKRGEQLTYEKQFELSHIHFRYPNAETDVLDDADMVIPAGASVGIVGASGSGKTTAVDILLGLLKPQSGSVLTDGRDIRSDYSGWLSHLSYIPQTIYMLDDTIRANVAFGLRAEEIDDAKVWEAVKEAQLGPFIDSLPDGIETKIGERGVRLSGGQRQRIGIARALYTDPELVILDEATSALDNETEAAIMESINSLHGRKTLVIIAHRLSTIEECDKIFRVEDGKITDK